MSKKQLVLAFFDTEDEANSAVSELKQWDKASKEIKLGAIGVLVKDDKGKIKTHKLGSRKTGTGAILFALAGVLSGGITVVGGAVIGALFGALFHKGLGMSKEDLARIGGELDGGKASVAVLADPQEAAAITAKLAELGGKPESYEVSEELVQEAETAAAEIPEEAPSEEAAEAPTEEQSAKPASA